MVVPSSVCTSESESFGIDLLVRSGLIATGCLLCSNQPFTLAGLVGMALNFGPNRGRHFMAKPGTSAMMAFGSGDHFKSNMEVVGDKIG